MSLYKDLLSALESGNPVIIDIAETRCRGKILYVERTDGDLLHCYSISAMDGKMPEPEPIRFGDPHYLFFNMDTTERKSGLIITDSQGVTVWHDNATVAFKSMIANKLLTETTYPLAILLMDDIIDGIQDPKVKSLRRTLHNMRRVIPTNLDRNLYRYSVGAGFGYVVLPESPSEEDYFRAIVGMASELGWTVSRRS